VREVYQCPVCSGPLAPHEAVPAVFQDHYPCPRCGVDLGTASAIALGQKAETEREERLARTLETYHR
jgi:hypothetical protein